jgi:hypothetical protein
MDARSGEKRSLLGGVTGESMFRSRNPVKSRPVDLTSEVH